MNMTWCGPVSRRGICRGSAAGASPNVIAAILVGDPQSLFEEVALCVGSLIEKNEEDQSR